MADIERIIKGEVLMQQEILVMKNKEHLFFIDKEIFVLLFDNTVVRRKNTFFNATQKGLIQFDDFVSLSRKGEVPYPLFFLDKASAEKTIEDYKKKVFYGVSKGQLSLSSRGDITLADISLILKDITRKQNYLKKYISKPNNISGMYAKTSKNLIDKAQEMRNIVGYDIEKVINLKNKEDSFNLIDKGLANHNVFISLYAHNYTPQDIDKLFQFSGIAIKDKRCPFIFIKAGDYDSSVELWGRRLFTTALLLSCLLHGDCRPVTMDGSCRDLVTDDHYLFAEEFLMPWNLFAKESCTSIDSVNKLADKYSVSPSAIVMRLYRLGMIDYSSKNEYLDLLAEEWRKVKNKKGGGRSISLEKGINRYNNRAVVEFVIRGYKTNKINAQEAKNLLCYKKGDKFNMVELLHV